MLKVEQLKIAVMDLSWPELSDFRKWYEEYEAQQWDKKIETDINNGKLDKLADEVLVDFESGLCMEL